MAHLRNHTLGLSALLLLLARPATAQPPPDAPPPDAPPAAEEPPPAPTPEAPPAEPPPEAAPAEPAPEAPPPAKAKDTFPPTVFPAPQPPPPPPPKRVKPLRTSVSILPTSADYGAEADIVSPLSKEKATILTRKWQATIRAWFRAPMRIGLGPRNDGTDGDELHSPPRIVGLRPTEWNYVGLAPPAGAQLFFTVENNKVSGNVIIGTDTLYDSGYDNLKAIGGISQAYVTLKFPEAFGSSGGFAWNVGALSGRYGMAGPKSKSTGYYGTYLFGRTHVAGETLTADIDLTDDLELVLEHGIGAKLDVIPFVQLTHVPPPPTAPYLPYQGPSPQGSNYLHHAHAALAINDWFEVGGHYLSSWSPNDFAQTMGERARQARMDIFGGDLHLDSAVAGNFYVGYSHIEAKRILPLADAVEVLHSPGGFYFKQNYFGPLNPALPPGEDSGKVDSVLGQYLIRLRPLLGLKPEGPDLSLALFGMFNHVDGPVLTIDKIKAGGELQVAPFRNVSIGARFDRVMPDGNNPDPMYSAISPRIIIHTNWLSREYIMFSYTRYMLGDTAYPSEREETPIPYAPYYPPITEADPNLFVLSAQVGF